MGPVLDGVAEHMASYPENRAFRADDWLLYDQDTPSSSGSRGLGRGNLFTRDGHLAVTVVQEGLIRVLRG